MVQNIMRIRFEIQRPPVYTLSSHATQDTFVNRENSYMNYCREGEMLIRNNKQIAFLSFDLPQIPNYGEVVSATLQLYKLNESMCPIAIYDLEQSFNEYDLTWVNYPAYTTLLSRAELSGIGYQEIDLLPTYLSKWIGKAQINLAIETESNIPVRIGTIDSGLSAIFTVKYEDTRVFSWGLRNLPGSMSLRQTDATALPGSITVNSKNVAASLPGSIVILAKPCSRTLPGIITLRQNKIAMLPGSVSIRQYDAAVNLSGSLTVRQRDQGIIPGSIIIKTYDGYDQLPGQIIIRRNGHDNLPGSIIIKSYDQDVLLPGKMLLRVSNNIELPGSISIRTHESSSSLPGSISLRLQTSLPGSITVRQKGEAALYGSMTLRMCAVLPGSLSIRQSSLPGQIRIRQTGVECLEGNLTVRVRDMAALPGAIIIGRKQKGYVFIM